MSFEDGDSLEKPHWGRQDSAEDAWGSSEERQEPEHKVEASRSNGASVQQFSFNDDDWGAGGGGFSEEPFETGYARGSDNHVFGQNAADGHNNGQPDLADDLQTLSLTKEPSEFTEETENDDFDQPFQTSATNAGSQEDDDDFGDFGDFDEAGDDFGVVGDSTTSPTLEERTAPIALAVAPTFAPFDVSDPSEEALRPQLQAIFQSLYAFTPNMHTDRRKERIDSQTLLPLELQAFHQRLLEPLELPPVNWKRSRTRRHYMIALGMPVNLDDIAQPPTSKSAMKSLAGSLQTEGVVRPSSPGPASAPIIRVSSSPPVSRRAAAPLPPVIDRSRANALLSMAASDFETLSVDELAKIRGELETMVSHASEVLTHTLEKREKLQTDGETYDRMIQDLVSTAQKLKPQGGVSGLKRSGSLPKSTSRAFVRRDISPAANAHRPPSRAGSLAS